TLNWTLVLIGALIAVALELCGVSSLAFAVGVYIPMQYTTPIFIGGVIRFLVDRIRWLRRRHRAQDEVGSIAECETSPGVLLASGYIAGGSLCSVGLAFLAMNDEVAKQFANWGEQFLRFNLSTGYWADWRTVQVFAILVIALLLVGLIPTR